MHSIPCNVVSINTSGNTMNLADRIKVHKSQIRPLITPLKPFKEIIAPFEGIKLNIFNFISITLWIKSNFKLFIGITNINKTCNHINYCSTQH